MIKVIHLVTIVFFMSLSSITQASESVPWNERHPTDKILHFVWGAGTQAGLSVGLSALGVSYASEIGLAGAVATGIAKECVDSHFDPFDFAATAGGGLVSYAIDKAIRLKFQSNIPKIEVGIQRNGAVLTASGNF